MRACVCVVVSQVKNCHGGKAMSNREKKFKIKSAMETHRSCEASCSVSHFLYFGARDDFVCFCALFFDF